VDSVASSGDHMRHVSPRHMDRALPIQELSQYSFFFFSISLSTNLIEYAATLYCMRKRESLPIADHSCAVARAKA